MIVGVGIDLCAIARMRDSLDRFGDRMWARILSERERAELAGRADRATALAGRFAAKEALVKALAGAPGVGWHDIEVHRERGSPPSIVLSGPARELASKREVGRVFLSITHDAGMAAAVVILERDEAATLRRNGGAG